MLQTIVGWLKSLFMGKGAIQIGKENQAVTGSTSGPNSPILNAGGNILYLTSSPPEEKHAALVPNPKLEVAKECLRNFARDGMERASGRNMDAQWFVEWSRDVGEDLKRKLGEDGKQAFKQAWKDEHLTEVRTAADAKVAFQRCCNWLLQKEATLDASDLTAQFRYA